MQKLQVVTIKDISLKMLQKSEFTKTSRYKNMYNAKSRKNALIICGFIVDDLTTTDLNNVFGNEKGVDVAIELIDFVVILVFSFPKKMKYVPQYNSW